MEIESSSDQGDLVIDVSDEDDDDSDVLHSDEEMEEVEPYVASTGMDESVSHKESLSEEHLDDEQITGNRNDIINPIFKKIKKTACSGYQPAQSSSATVNNPLLKNRRTTNLERKIATVYHDHDYFKHPISSDNCTLPDEKQRNKRKTKHNITVSSLRLTGPCLPTFIKKHVPEWGLNYVFHGEILPMFWASVMEKFQNILEMYLLGDGWLMQDFLSEKAKLDIQHLCGCQFTPNGNSEERNRHSELVFMVLFICAKFQFLSPWRYKPGENYPILEPRDENIIETKFLSLNFDEVSCLKRHIGGLFLLYSIYSQQFNDLCHSESIHKIPLDGEDMNAITVILEDVKNLTDNSIKAEVFGVITTLHSESAFDLKVLQTENGLETPILHLNKIMNHPRLSYFRRMKDFRDMMLYCNKHQFTPMLNSLHQVISEKKSLFKVDRSSEHNQDTMPSTSTCNRNNSKDEFLWDSQKVEELKRERNLVKIQAALESIMEFLTPPNVIVSHRLLAFKNLDTIKQLLHKSLREFRRNDLRKDQTKTVLEKRYKIFDSSKDMSADKVYLDLKCEKTIREYLNPAPLNPELVVGPEDIHKRLENGDEILSYYPEVVLGSRNVEIAESPQKKNKQDFTPIATKRRKDTFNVIRKTDIKETPLIPLLPENVLESVIQPDDSHAHYLVMHKEMPDFQSLITEKGTIAGKKGPASASELYKEMKIKGEILQKSLQVRKSDQSTTKECNFPGPSFFKGIEDHTYCVVVNNKTPSNQQCVLAQPDMKSEPKDTTNSAFNLNKKQEKVSVSVHPATSEKNPIVTPPVKPSKVTPVMLNMPEL